MAELQDLIRELICINNLHKNSFCFSPHTINLSVYAFNFKCKNYSNIAFQQGVLHVSLDPGLTSV